MNDIIGSIPVVRKEGKRVLEFDLNMIQYKNKNFKKKKVLEEEYIAQEIKILDLDIEYIVKQKLGAKLERRFIEEIIQNKKKTGILYRWITREIYYH